MDRPSAPILRQTGSAGEVLIVRVTSKKPFAQPAAAMALDGRRVLALSTSGRKIKAVEARPVARAVLAVAVSQSTRRSRYQKGPALVLSLAGAVQVAAIAPSTGHCGTAKTGAMEKVGRNPLALSTIGQSMG